jgi:CDP-diacylglycerol--glycerol-3-phosphate 3-phosphatidyltransferase
VSVVSPNLRTRIRGIATPIAVAMGKVGLTPNALTLIGFAITVVGAILVATQNWIIGGIVVFVGGAFDLFDGALARATGKVSRLGAFLDSVFDKAGEIISYLGVAIGLGSAGFVEGTYLAAAAMGAAIMVSYTRAKSEGLGFTSGTGMAAVGLMPREVRLVLLSLGIVLVPTPVYQPGSSLQGGLLTVALVVIAVGGAITAIQRIVHVLRQPIPEETT